MQIYTENIEYEGKKGDRAEEGKMCERKLSGKDFIIIIIRIEIFCLVFNFLVVCAKRTYQFAIFLNKFVDIFDQIYFIGRVSTFWILSGV